MRKFRKAEQKLDEADDENGYIVDETKIGMLGNFHMRCGTSSPSSP
jgi:hypothetical protein